MKKDSSRCPSSQCTRHRGQQKPVGCVRLFFRVESHGDNARRDHQNHKRDGNNNLHSRSPSFSHQTSGAWQTAAACCNKSSFNSTRGANIAQPGKGPGTKGCRTASNPDGGASDLNPVTPRSKSPHASQSGKATTPSIQTLRQPIGYAFVSLLRHLFQLRKSRPLRR